MHGLAKSLVNLGHEVHVFTTNVDGAGVSDVPACRATDLDGVKVWYFPVSWPRRIMRAPEMVTSLRRVVHQFAVVHLHSVFLWPTWAAAQAARKACVPYVVSPRGMLIKELIAKRSWLAKSAWIGLIESANLTHAAAVHLTSELEAREIQRFGWRLPRMVIIPNGIDEPQPCAGDIGADVEAIVSEQPLVLFLGRLSWKKGLDRLLRAFAHTRAGKLAIVGTDDEGLTPQLARLAEGLRIADRVRILPRTVIGPEKERLFAAAQLFVLSSYSENFGNTVLEAMRRGVPVVVTPEVGAAELVQGSGGGLVVAGDAEPLGAAICRLTTDRSLAQSMGQAGQRHAVTHYTWARIAARMEDMYKSFACRDRALNAVNL